MSSVPPVHPPKAILRAAGRHWPFLVVLSLYLMLAAGYRHAVPAWEAPDEPQHFAYVAYLRAHGGPPIQDSREGHNPVVIGYHPPLYYYLAALLTLPLDLSDVRRVVPNPYFSFANDDGGANTVDHTGEGQITPQALAALGRIRALSILLGAGTVLCTYLSGLLMFGDRRWQWAGAGQVPATLATGAVGLLPQFVFISSATNNDNAVNFCCALNLLLCLRFVRRVRTQPGRVPWGECGLLGLVAGLGLLSKSSAVVCLPLIGLALILVARRQRSRALFLQGTLAAAAACVAVAGWWFGGHRSCTATSRAGISCGRTGPPSINWARSR